MVCAFKATTGEAALGEFQVSQGYILRPCLKIN